MNEFEVYTEYANGQSSLNSIVRGSTRRGYPIRVVLRALQNGRLTQYSDLQRRRLLAEVLREEVLREIMNYRRSQVYAWSRERAGRATGYLQGFIF